MKTCFKCGIDRPPSEFYKHPKMADGYVNKCKECNKSDVRKNYAARFEQYQAYEKSRAQLPHRKAASKVYQKEHPEKMHEYNVEYWTKNPKKRKAHNAVNNAVRDGRLERKPCERCGSLRVHGHHDDYSKPLDVMWLCPKHHKERHREIEPVATV